MILVPRRASDEEVLCIVREWIDVLAREDYATVFDALGYGLAFDEPGDECIRRAIKSYRSPQLYPGIGEFTVTDWRAARGGCPEPKQELIWYQGNSTAMAGAIQFFLPLNGKWSDLCADFVLWESDDSDSHCVLGLEEIGSWSQTVREQP